MSDDEKPETMTETSASTTAEPAAAVPAAGGDWRRRRRGPRTDSLAAVRRSISREYRALAGWLPEDLPAALRIARARALGDLLAKIASTIRDAEVEQRLGKLEDLLRGNGRAH